MAGIRLGAARDERRVLPAASRDAVASGAGDACGSRLLLRRIVPRRALAPDGIPAIIAHRAVAELLGLPRRPCRGPAKASASCGIPAVDPVWGGSRRVDQRARSAPLPLDAV